MKNLHGQQFMFYRKQGLGDQYTLPIVLKELYTFPKYFLFPQGEGKGKTN